MGGVGSLALVGGYPSDGVTKKILVVVSPKSLSSQESNMDYQNIVNNGVNETGTEGEGLSPGRCLMAQQHEPGRHQATARRIRRKWSQDDNRIVMECYYRSEPGRIGYRKRMHSIWTSKAMFPVTEQRLLEQKNQIIKSNGFPVWNLKRLSNQLKMQCMGR